MTTMISSTTCCMGREQSRWMERVKRELENGRECSLLKPGERIFFSQLKESDTCKSAKTGTAEHTHRSPVSRAASFNLPFLRPLLGSLSATHLPYPRVFWFEAYGSKGIQNCQKQIILFAKQMILFSSLIFSTDDLFRRGIFVGLSSPHLPQQWSCFR